MAQKYDDLIGITLGQFLRQKSEKNGDKICLKFLHDGSALSYRDLDDVTNRVANGLKAVGLGKGSHVAVISENRPEQIYLYLALAKSGGVSVPVNTASKGSFLEYFLDQSDCNAVAVEPVHLERLSEVISQLPKLTMVILLPDIDATETRPEVPKELSHLRLVIFSELMRASSDPVDDSDALDMVQIMYTSGTTGRSKGNMYSHTSILNWARQWAVPLELGPDDVYLVVFPLFHAGSWLSCTMTTLWSDGTVALGRRFSATRFFDQARACGATAAFMVSVAGFLAAQPASASDRDHRIKFLITAPPPPDPLGFQERFGLKLAAGYGLSDFGTSHATGLKLPSSKMGSSGRIVPDWEVKCIDDDGREVSAGCPGEILMRCNVPGGTPSGYYKMPEATLESRRDLWFHTGDMGYIDEDGYLYFVDRKKDAIRRRGENISSVELETVVGRHPDIASVAFFPVASKDTEDEVAVAVVCHGGKQITEAQLVEFCHRELPAYAVPRYVRIVENFPFTPNGKIEKIKLRHETETMIADVWDRMA